MNRTLAEQVQLLSYQYEDALRKANREGSSEKTLTHYMEAANAQYEMSRLLTGESAARHEREMNRLVLFVRDEVLRLGIEVSDELRKGMEIMGIKLPEKMEAKAADTPKTESPSKPAEPKKPAASKKPETHKATAARSEYIEKELLGFDPESCRLTELPEASFADFGDMGHEVQAVVTCLEVARAKQEYQRLAAQMSKRRPNILLYGPPGGGKTHFCRAISNYVMREMEGGVFFMITGSQIRHSYVGVTEKRLKAVFEAARKYEFPVICIDEIETILPVREGDVPNYVATLVTEFLQMMDGVDGRFKGTVIGATNFPMQVDVAVRSRLSTEVYVGLPDADHIADYLRKNTAKYLGNNKDFVEEIVRMCLDKLTNASYRVLQWILDQIETAALDKTRRAYPDNKDVEVFVPLTRQEVEKIMERVTLDYNPEYMETLEKFRNRNKRQK